MWKLFHKSFPFNGAGRMLVYWFTTKDTREVKFSSIYTDARTFILILGWGNVKIQKTQIVSKVLL